MIKLIRPHDKEPGIMFFNRANCLRSFLQIHAYTKQFNNPSPIKRTLNFLSRCRSSIRSVEA